MGRGNEDLKNIEVASTGDHHRVAGQPLYERLFHHVLKFHSPGIAPVTDSTGAFHINIKGKDLYPHRFKRTFGFYDELAAVQSEGGWFHITVTGNPLYKERYRWCGNFQEGLCPVQDEAGDYFHINSLGMRVYEENYSYVGDFKDGIAVVHSDGGATHIDRKGALLHGRWFRDLDIFHKGFARARDDKGWFHLIKEGTPLYEDRYLEIEPFYNGVARVIPFHQSPLMIDESGRTIASLCTFGKPPSPQSPFENPSKKRVLQELSADFVGFWPLEVIKQALHLGLFDLLPASPSELSSHLSLSQEILQRLLRALEEIKIVEKEIHGKPFGRYVLTAKGHLLCPTHKAPMAAAALMWADVQREWQKKDFLRLPPCHRSTFKR